MYGNSINYSEHNKQTKKRKKLVTLSRSVEVSKLTLKFSYSFSPQIAWHIKMTNILDDTWKNNITCFK